MGSRVYNLGRTAIITLGAHVLELPPLCASSMLVPKRYFTSLPTLLLPRDDARGIPCPRMLSHNKF